MAYFNNTKDFLVALKGDKGDSPTITAERVEGGVKLTITNPDGTGSIQTVWDGTGGGGSSHGDVVNIKYLRTSDDGLIDTYLIQFEDNSSYEFQLHNGGKGGGSNIDLDTTLTQAGKAADAKAVGDRFEEIDEVIVDMASGGTGYVRNVQTFDGETTMKFFIGTEEEYKALTAEQKEDLFAIITNDSTQTDIAEAVKGLLDGTVYAKTAEKAINSIDGDGLVNLVRSPVDNYTRYYTGMESRKTFEWGLLAFRVVNHDTNSDIRFICEVGSGDRGTTCSPVFYDKITDDVGSKFYPMRVLFTHDVVGRYSAKFQVLESSSSNDWTTLPDEGAYNGALYYKHLRSYPVG